jgi:hypothetical protein
MFKSGKYFGVGTWKSISNAKLEQLELNVDLRREDNYLSISGFHRGHEAQTCIYFELQADLAGTIIWVIHGVYNNKDIEGAISRDGDNFNILAKFVRCGSSMSASLIPKDKIIRLSILTEKDGDIIDANLDVCSEDKTTTEKSVVSLRGNGNEIA